jgi:shikimate kinase
MARIILLGYMGSGKSTIARLLASKLALPVFDLDVIIENENGMSIKELFKNKGEVYFRKLETETLIRFLSSTSSFVLSLGGGTPCYGNNMELVNGASNTSIYLNTSVNELYSRLLSEKENRPLIAALSDQEMKEFVAKHLFERSFFYNQAKYTLVGDNKSPEAIVNEIELLLV